MPLFRSRVLCAPSLDSRTRQPFATPLPPPGTRPPAPELTQATSSSFLGAAAGCPGGPARGRLAGDPRAAHAGRGSRCLRHPRSAEPRLGFAATAPSWRPSDRGDLGTPGAGNRYASAPRAGAPCHPAPAPAPRPHLQQLHVARREPAAEPVLLLALPPAAVRDLQQCDQLTRGEAQPLAVPLPGEGVKGPAADAGHGLGARAHSAACIPAEPRGLGSGSAGSQAPGTPGSCALGARRLGAARGSPARRGTRAPRREAETRWLRRASGDAPGPGARRSQLWAGGRGSGGGDPGAAGSADNFPGTRNAGSRREGQPEQGPLWRAEMRSSRGRWDPEHHPLALSAAREWPGVRGEGLAAGWPSGGSLRGEGGGAGAGPGRPRPLRAGRSLSLRAGHWGGVSPLTPPMRKAAGLGTPLCAVR